MEQTRRLRKKEITHRAIMHSAKVLYEKDGIENVTIDDIAEGADISRSTFFTHFDSVNDLLSQIADTEIDDIFAAAGDENALNVSAVFKKLAEDTYPYPYFFTELMVKSILSSESSSVAKVFSLIRNEIEKEGFEESLKEFSSKDISAFIFGAYFGLVFQKIINDEPFENPDETNDKIQRYINYLKNQEENDHE